MKIQQPHFGRQVRQIRRAQGLSQSDLAGEEMSPSYISLVESGRRAPSIKFARLIAERLSLPAEALLAPEEGSERQRPHRLGLVGRLVAARAHQSDGNWDLARDELTDIVDLAGTPELGDVRWEARWELATTLGRLGESEAREQMLRTLLADPLTTDFPPLHTRVAVEIAQAVKDTGTLTESARFAEEAIRVARSADPPAPDETSQAEAVLLSVCTESGDWERAAELADELLRDTDAPTGRPRATTLWAAAWARYVGGLTEEALTLMAEAEQSMAQTSDLPLRARLQLAAGLLHVAAGRPDSADGLLRRAGQVAELVGTHTDRMRLAAALALVALHRGDREDADRLVAVVDAGLARLTVLDRARCSVVTARVHRARDEEDTARQCFQSAAALYEQAGAYRIAVTVWRELSAPDGSPAGVDPHVLLLP
ncbi:helix-turn-helix domain-containing protein [Streptomyces phaeochromogenes]|uniref:helix-turn-helix domain-containing protein n=1 Tax=Streptomyces phaeochromogenes TaxID=1923 RepID=UPI00371CC519